MSAQPDLVSLYSAALLELASSLPETRPAQSLGAAARRGYARSPQCGSSVELHVVMDDDGIAELSHTVRACALGQAAASAVAQAAVGADLPQITLARTQLEAMLTQDGPTPQAPFEKLELLRAAREFKNRHASILLYLKALETAMQP
ncbi:MAG: iron-sulfur cluster assembly scaffold protein [Paracoccaceae bacterium]|jgi:NifU-like protein involved in Fe-S cluster formation